MQISDNVYRMLREKNYFYENEKTWEDICFRVSENIASIEDDNEKYADIFFNMMSERAFIPSTPCLLNAGTNVQQLSSCFIIDIDDTIESIMETAGECAKIFQKSGGAGFNISKLRPRGSELKNSGGKASGPVSFMKIFDSVVEEVKHGNSRKGALKVDLNCDHPDIFEFIHCKDNIDQLTNMNISVSVTDEFMDAVVGNKKWDLVFNDKVHKTVKAKDLWSEIIDSAWKTGEPGISFRSIMDKGNANPHLGVIESSNPCLHKDTYMVTENGLEKISNLKSKIWNGKGFVSAKSWKTGNKKVIRIVTKNGFEYITTPDHKFLLRNGKWCKAENLKGKDIRFDISEKEWIGVNKYPEINYETLGFVFNVNTIPDWIMQLPKQEMKDFLKGLFCKLGVDLEIYREIVLGFIVNTDMLKQIQQMLLLFGIKGRLLTYKQSSDIVISGHSYKKFLNDIGFIQDRKGDCEELECEDEDDFETVILISELDDAEVWDFSEPLSNKGLTNGAYVHNCMEFVNIPYSSCNLGSLNLLKFVDDGEFDWGKFEEYIGYAVRFLDNMVSLNKLPLPEIQKVTEQIRPIGLGTMGLADALFALNIAMNSKRGLDFIDKLYAFLYNTAVKESEKLAEERGVYPAWEGSTWEEDNIKIRNSSLISIAPNGSIGFIAEVNGGIEPVFSLAYTRRTADGQEFFIVNNVLKEKLEELELYSEEMVNRIIENNGSIKGIKEIPRRVQNVFVTSMDMTPDDHVECLQRVSKHVDLSTAKTVNLPKYASVSDVSDIYLKVWKTGVIKGITVYRDGSRKDQVLSLKGKKQKLERGYVEPAPEVSVGKTVKVHSGCGSLWVTLNKNDEGNANHIFVNRGSKGTCVAHQIAVSRLISLALRGGIKPEDVVDQLLSIETCSSFRDLNRDAKRNGKKYSRGSSCPAAIGILLDEYVNEGDGSIADEVETNRCPDCGEELLMVGSCISCPYCGFSRCS